MLYDKIRDAIKTNSSLIIEGNFKNKQRRAIKKLLKADTEVVEVYCYAGGWLPFTRYVQRNRSGERHRGHRDTLWYTLVLWDVFTSKLGFFDMYKPLGLSSRVIKVDSTDFKKIDYGRILACIKHP